MLKRQGWYEHQLRSDIAETDCCTQLFNATSYREGVNLPGANKPSNWIELQEVVLQLCKQFSKGWQAREIMVFQQPFYLWEPR